MRSRQACTLVVEEVNEIVHIVIALARDLEARRLLGVRVLPRYAPGFHIYTLYNDTAVDLYVGVLFPTQFHLLQ